MDDIDIKDSDNASMAVDYADEDETWEYYGGDEEDIGWKVLQQEREAVEYANGQAALLKVEDSRIVKKFDDVHYEMHVAVVDSRIIGKELGLDEGKLLDVLYKIMDDADFQFQMYGTTKTFLCEQLGWNDRHYTKKEIHSKLYEYFETLRIGGRAYNLFDRYKGKDKADWQKPSLTTGFISEHNLNEKNIEVEDIVFTIGYMHRIILSNPKAFGKFSIDINVTFKTIQAKRLYDYTIVECGLRHEQFKKEGELTIEITGIKEKIHPLLEIGNAKLSNKKLTVLVEKILEEINENPLSRIIIKTLKTEEKTGKTGNQIIKKKYVETIKNKKEICGYRYYVTKKATVKALLSSKRSVPGNIEQPEQQNESVDSLHPEIMDMLKCHFNEPDIAAIIQKAKNKYPDYDLNVYIPKCIKYTKDHNPKNFSGYLRTAIEGDHAGFGTWIGEQADKHRKAEERKQREEQAEMRQQQDADMQEKDYREIVSKQLKEINVIERQEIWHNCLNIIEKEIGIAQIDIWFRVSLLFSDSSNNYYLVLPSDFVVNHIEEHYGTTVRAALSGVAVASFCMTTVEGMKVKVK